MWACIAPYLISRDKPGKEQQPKIDFEGISGNRVNHREFVGELDQYISGDFYFLQITLTKEL